MPGGLSFFANLREGLQALPCRRSTGLDAGEVIAPMACETPPALSSERAAELGKHAESSLLAVIRELVGPQRDQLRQVRATSNMLRRSPRPWCRRCSWRLRARVARLALIRCCSFCCNLLASSLRSLSIRAPRAARRRSRRGNKSRAPLRPPLEGAPLFDAAPANITNGRLIPARPFRITV